MRSAAALVLVAAAVAGCVSAPQKRGVADPAKAAEIHASLGVAYLREGRLEHALARLERAIALDPRNVVAHNALGVVHERLGRDAEAERHYRRALRLAPDDPDALNNLGRFLCARGRGDEAMGLFRRAAANPSYSVPWVAYTNAGLCALRRGDRGAAEKALRRALALEPRFAPALLAMAQITFETGRALSARGYLQRYHEVGPQTAQSLWLAVRVERALGDRDAAASYALLLKGKFPDAPETRALLEAEKTKP